MNTEYQIKIDNNSWEKYVNEFNEFIKIFEKYEILAKNIRKYYNIEVKDRVNLLKLYIDPVERILINEMFSDDSFTNYLNLEKERLKNIINFFNNIPPNNKLYNLVQILRHSLLLILNNDEESKENLKTLMKVLPGYRDLIEFLLNNHKSWRVEILKDILINHRNFINDLKKGELDLIKLKKLFKDLEKEIKRRHFSLKNKFLSIVTNVEDIEIGKNLYRLLNLIEDIELEVDKQFIYLLVNIFENKKESDVKSYIDSCNTRDELKRCVNNLISRYKENLKNTKFYEDLEYNYLTDKEKRISIVLILLNTYFNNYKYYKQLNKKISKFLKHLKDKNKYKIISESYKRITVGGKNTHIFLIEKNAEHNKISIFPRPSDVIVICGSYNDIDIYGDIKAIIFKRDAEQNTVHINGFSVELLEIGDSTEHNAICGAKDITNILITDKSSYNTICAKNISNIIIKDKSSHNEIFANNIEKIRIEGNYNDILVKTIRNITVFGEHNEIYILPKVEIIKETTTPSIMERIDKLMEIIKNSEKTSHNDIKSSERLKDVKLKNKGEYNKITVIPNNILKRKIQKELIVL